MKELIRRLHEGAYSCIVANEGKVAVFTRRGVMDLYELLVNEPDFLRGASVADKVVGKGAAALMLLGGVQRLYADVISEPALGLLDKTNVEVSYGQLVQHVQNRTKTDWCPVEKLCYNLNDTREMFEAIGSFLEAQK